MKDETQTQLPEAPTSATYTIESKNGFNILFTVRNGATNEDIKQQLDIMDNLDKALALREYKPQQKRTFGFPKKEEKPKEYVKDRLCPVCKNQLIYFEAKGQKHIKCSTAGYDFKTKQKTGCTFVEWQA